MNKWQLGALLVCCIGSVTAPAVAQTSIPAGKDTWRTPANGNTFFTLPDGDLEALCGAPPSSAWDHTLRFRGEPLPGLDWDTMVVRIDPARFNPKNVARTRIHVGTLQFASMSSVATPCGTLSFTVELDGSEQPITDMVIVRTSAGGGTFYANLAVNVEIKAFEVHHGDYVGSLFYTMHLPDGPAGTPWSFSPEGRFRPGMTTSNNCIEVLRAKIGTLPAYHSYFLSDMIAQGQCEFPK